MNTRLLSFALTLTICRMLSADEPPNIVLVMADDQGWGDMAYNGHPEVKTPHFDVFAKEGIRFDHFHSAAPVCSPTRGSVMTGRTPNRFGCFSWGHPLRPQEITLAEALKTAGWRTGHFGKWHLGSVQKGSPVSPGASGFDEWVSSPNYFDLDPVLSVQGKATQFKGDSSDITVDLALDFIRRCAEQKQRFLTVVWFGSPHDPHQPLAADAAMYDGLPKVKQNFYAEITAMDRAFGRLRGELSTLGLRDDTILWYCSDNGARKKVGSSGGRRGHKGTVYEGGLLVPGLLEWPGKWDAPRTIKEPCVTSDIYPTILAAAGVQVPEQPVLDGQNLLPLLEGQSFKRQPVGFWDYPEKGISTPSKVWMEQLLEEQAKGNEPTDPERLMSDAAEIKTKLATNKFPGRAAWLDGRWKMLRTQHPKTGVVNWELYDLEADPAEAFTLYAEQPERVAKMQKDLEDWLESVARSYNGEDYKK